MHNQQAIDYAINWLKYLKNQPKLWLVSLLVAIPLSSIMALYSYKQAYVSPSFAGIIATNGIAQVYITGEGTHSPLDTSILEELKRSAPNIYPSAEKQLPLKAMLSIGQPQPVDVNVSFFSGGFQQLGLSAFQGSLEKMEFPSAGSEVVGAISYQLWLTHFKKQNPLNQAISINGVMIKIVAVLPPEFRSLRKNTQTDIVIPYAFKQNITGSDAFTPDTLTYLLGVDTTRAQQLLDNAKPSLIENFFIFDDNNLEAISAFGLTPSDYLVTTQRVLMLTLVFVTLLLFCIIAFCGYVIGELYKKQKEYLVRTMSGANKQDIRIQKLIEESLLALFVTLLVMVLQPVAHYMIFDFFNTKQSHLPVSQLILFYAILASCHFALVRALTLTQENTVKTSLGRSSSLTLSERIQAYGLLSFLMCTTLTALVIASSALNQQMALSKVSYGFKPENIQYFELKIDNNNQSTFYANDQHRQLLFELQKIPALDHVALSFTVPLLDRSTFSQWYTSSGKAIGDTQQTETASIAVTPDYFSVMGTKLIIGSTFKESDYTKVIVNQTLWKRYFKEQSLSNALLIRVDTSGQSRKYQVIGVVEDIKYQGPDNKPTPVVFEPKVTLTGNEVIIVKNETGLFDKSVIQQSVKSISQKYDIGSTWQLENLVYEEQKPRWTITVLTLIVAITLLLASVLFSASLVSQLIQKLALELSLKHSMGARFISLFMQLYLPFFTPFFIFSAGIFISLPYLSEFAALEHLTHATIGKQNTLFIACCFSLIAITSAIFMINLKKNSNNTWHTLS